MGVLSQYTRRVQLGAYVQEWIAVARTFVFALAVLLVVAAKRPGPD